MPCNNRVGGDGGISVPPQDVFQLGKAIANMLTDQKMLNDLSKRASAYASLSDWDVSAAFSGCSD